MLRLMFLAVLILCLTALEPSAQVTHPAQVSVVTVDGPINPVTAAYLQRHLKASAQRGDRLLLIEMDTPGGLDLAMRGIVKEIFSSSVPVAVFVAPSGARAASAGAVIALASDICALSPGTNIGAAHPVSMGGAPDKIMQEKVLNDAEAYIEGIARKRGRNVDAAKMMVRQSVSLTAERALQEKVIDLIAFDRNDLLKKLEGHRVVREGRETLLKLAGAPVVEYQMGTRDKILDLISNPDVAYLLLLLGFLGIFMELSTPGAIFPGVIGVISLVMAFFAFQTLPVNYAGAFLILLAMVLFIAEIKIISHGILALGGILALVLGSLLLFPSPEPYLRVSRSVLVTTVLVAALAAGLVITKAVQAHRLRPVSGPEGMLGLTGVADTDIEAAGKVLVRGEYWNATSDEPIAKGETVEVVSMEGLRLTVKRKT